MYEWWSGVTTLHKYITEQALHPIINKLQIQEKMLRTKTYIIHEQCTGVTLYNVIIKHTLQFIIWAMQTCLRMLEMYNSHNK